MRRSFSVAAALLGFLPACSKDEGAPLPGNVTATQACTHRPREWPFDDPNDEPFPIDGANWNQVTVAPDGAVHWNDGPATFTQLREYMALMTTMGPWTHVILDAPATSDCATAERVRRLMDEADLCRRGGCSEAPRWRARGFPNASEYRNRYADIERRQD